MNLRSSLLLLLLLGLPAVAPADDSDFDGLFHSHKGSSEANRPYLLEITATIDGSDRFIFTQRGVRCVHKFWKEASDVQFNGHPWANLNRSPTGWAEEAIALDLPKARIVKRRGRDVVALETTPDGFDLTLCDSPNGADTYEVTIEIPRKGELE